MASKFVVPFELPNLYGTPSSIADAGFVVCYIKDGWWTKKSPDNTEADLVLDRPLTGLLELESTDEINQYDTVKSALEKLQQSILTLELTGGIQGTGYYTGGRFLLQTTLPNVTNFTCADVEACPVITGIQTTLSNFEDDISGINQTLAGLAIVASTGSYDDLTDKPTIPTQVNADWNSETGASQILNKPVLSDVATSGSYNDLTGLPTIPTLALSAPELTSPRSAEINNEYNAGDIVYSGGNIYLCIATNSAYPVTDTSYWTLLSTGYKTRQQAVDWAASTGDYQILNKPSTFPPELHTHAISDIESLQDTINGINTYIGNVESSVPIYTTDLDDVSTTQPTDQQVLKFNSSLNVYVPSDMTVIGTLNDLSDVDTTGASTGDALKFDGTNWVAGQVSGLPTGGTAGQILTKVDATDYNAIWQDNYADWTSVVKHTVKNDGTAVIPKGKAVYASGSNGTNILVRAASNGSEATSSKTMGLLQSQLDTNGNSQTGFVITEGLLGGLNTQGQTAGDPVWLGTNGDLIYGLTNKPAAPNHLVFIGIVTKVSEGSGEIFVKVQNGFEVRELHDVSAASPSNNDVLRYNSSNHLWEAAPVIVPAGMTWMGAFPG